MSTGLEQRFSRVLSMVRARATSHVLVSCQEHRDAPAVDLAAEPDVVEVDAVDVVEVVLSQCPGQTPDWMLVDLAVAGGGIVVVDQQRCPGSGARVVDLARLTAERVRPGVVDRRVVVSLSVARPPMSRRGILSTRPPEAVVVHDQEDPRSRLVESLRSLGGDQVCGSAPALELNASACIACGVCVRACAHDALELGTAGGCTTLVQHPDRCQGDRTCVSACPTTAIEVVGHHDWTTVLAGHPLPLARLATTTCSRCHITMPEGRALCQACGERAEDPFGVHLPPRLMDSLPAKYRERLGG